MGLLGAKRLGFIIAINLIGAMSLAQAPSDNAATRDPEAKQLLMTALRQSGGSAAWQNVHAIRSAGSMTLDNHASSGASKITYQLNWIDDWSMKNPRYVRSVTSAKGTHTVRHDATDSSTAEIKGKRIQVRALDKATVLLTHIPAAALSIIENDADYSIQPDPRNSTTNDIVVDVRRGNGLCQQQWYVSRKTGQIDLVRFAVPDAIQGFHQPWETVVYKHYQQVGSLTVPDETLLIRPDGEAIAFHFSSVERNPAVSASDFSQGTTR